MTDKRIGRVYKSVINKITKKIKTQHNCMKRATNNPDYVYMLGNKCIKPVIKSKKNNRHAHYLSYVIFRVTIICGSSTALFFSIIKISVKKGLELI
jgi:hypothetical protein